MPADLLLTLRTGVIHLLMYIPCLCREAWGGALALAARHMGAQDVVVALTAVGATLALCAQV